MQSTDPTAGASAPQPGWYPDPWQVAPTRWWDGITWTGFTTPVHAPRAGYAAPSPIVANDGYARGNSYGRSYANSHAHAPVGLASVPAVRDDIRGGGVALLGYFGGIALSVLLPQFATAFGVRSFTVPSLVLSMTGLWTGLWMAAYVVAHRRPGGTMADLGWSLPAGGDFGIGIAIGISGLIVANEVSVVLRHLYPDLGGSHFLVTVDPSYGYLMAFALMACIGAPIIEELFFRGLVQTVLTRSLGSVPAIVIQAMLFGFAHFQLGMTFNQAAVRCGTVMVLGLLNGWLRVMTGRLGAGMVAHSTYNSIITIITFVTLVAR